MKETKPTPVITTSSEGHCGFILLKLAEASEKQELLVLEANAVALHLLAQPADAIRNKNLFDLWPEWAPNLAEREQLLHALRTERGLYTQFYSPPHDKQIKCHLIAIDSDRVCMLFDDNALGLPAKQITPEHNHLLYSVIDHIPDSIYIKDLEGRKILSNLADCEYMGLDHREEAIGKTDFDVYAPELAEHFQQDDKVVIQQKRDVLNRLENIPDKNGQERWVLSSKIPWYNGNGKIQGILGIGRNITDYSRTVRELAVEKEKLKRYLEIVPSVVVSLDLEGRITLLNEFGCDVFECRADEVIGTSWLDLCADDQERSKAKHFITKALGRRRSAKSFVELRMLSQKGHKRLVRWFSRALKDSHGQP